MCSSLEKKHIKEHIIIIVKLGKCNSHAMKSHQLSLVGAATSIIFVVTKVLSQQTCVCHDKTHLLSQQKYACRNKKIFLLRQNLWQIFVATNTKIFFRDKHNFVCIGAILFVTTKLLSRQIFVVTNIVVTKLFCQLPPMIINTVSQSILKTPVTRRSLWTAPT